MLTTTKRTILYIEDDASSVQLVERILRHAGYNVVIARRGLEGIDLARRIEPDLILTDLGLPDLSGREVATALRADERFRHTPIVAVTAGGEDQRETSMASGINGFLMKPVDISSLPRKLEFYMKGGQDEIDADTLASAQMRYTQELVNRLENRIRELEDSNDSLHRLDQMKDLFIQLTAHEMRTPLTLVNGYSRLVMDNPHVKRVIDQDPAVGELVKGLVGAVERMQGIVDELLITSRIITNQIDLSTGPTNLRRIMQSVIKSYDTALRERNLTVHFEPQQWPASIRADMDLMQLAITNLLGNAIKFTPDSGHIFLAAYVENETVHFSIRDTGVGIEKSEQVYIFERFHTTQDIATHSTSKTAFGGGGLGLGLPVCKGIIEAHGGTVEVKSSGYDPVKLPGSEFIVTLPVNASSQKVPSSVIKPLESTS